MSKVKENTSILDLVKVTDFFSNKTLLKLTKVAQQVSDKYNVDLDEVSVDNVVSTALDVLKERIAIAKDQNIKASFKKLN